MKPTECVWLWQTHCENVMIDRNPKLASTHFRGPCCVNHHFEEPVMTDIQF
jgi:hypothetical protein